MKALLLCFTTLFCAIAQAQYYYKDVIGNSETTALLHQYKAGKISRVVLQSYDADDTRNEDFLVTQSFDIANGTLHTQTSLGAENASTLTTIINAAGNIVKTVDSNGTSISTTEYFYLPDGKLAKVIAVSADTSGAFQVKEEHHWQWSGSKPAGMLRIRNGKDTSTITFKHDEAGNVTEEHSTRNGVASEPVYYYYNEKNQLTDIVRFNKKAARLLPEYMFEYNGAGQVIQRITFPSNSSEYTIWRYQYNAQGLRIKEAVYNKQKQLTGKIEYQYSAAR